jgi:hypothetical protein
LGVNVARILTARAVTTEESHLHARPCNVNIGRRSVIAMNLRDATNDHEPRFARYFGELPRET